MMTNEYRFGERHVAAAGYEKEGDYWLDQFSGELIKSQFPFNINGGEIHQYSLGTIKAVLPGELGQPLMKLRNNSDPRLFMILATGIIMLLWKYTGNRDIIVGAPIYRQETEGDFINTVIGLRNQLDEDMTFKNLLLKMRDTIIKAYENQNYPMETLLLQLGKSISEIDFPLFDVVVLLENLHDKKYLGSIKPGMMFSFLRTDDIVELNTTYNFYRYDESLIKNIHKHLFSLLNQALLDVNIPIGQMDMLSDSEKKQLLYEFNDTNSADEKDKTLHQLFQEQVEKTPYHAAVVVDDSALTYLELHRNSNRLAGYLKAKGVKLGAIVGIMAAPSLERIEIQLGVLKAGGAYLPIDPSAPEERTLSILRDCRVRLILTSREMIGGKHSYTSLQGLKDKEAKPCFIPPKEQITKLESLPFPDRSLVNYEKYNQYIGQAMVTDIISLQTARGCPYQCAYCTKIWNKTHIFRSADSIFDELMIYYNMGIRRFSIFDDIFNINLENGMKFFKRIIDNRLDIHLFFPNGLRGDLLTREYIDLAVEAGLSSTALALETASSRLQEMIKKNLNLEKFRENAQYICTQYPQVILEMFTIHGFPTETEEEALMTLDFIKSLQWIHFPYVFILKIYPNTPMEKIALENGILREDILKCETLALHETSPTSPFNRSFSKKYQADFLNNYFLNKERLLTLLPHQLRILTRDEMVQKYESYLPVKIKGFDQLLAALGITAEELDFTDFLEENNFMVPDFNEKLRQYFPVKRKEKNAFRVLFLDLSQYFSADTDMLYDVVEPPLGGMYLMTYLQKHLGHHVHGKIAKSRIDFDSYSQLKSLLEDFRPQVIALRTLTFYKNFFHSTIAIIRQWGYDIPIIVGGPYVSADCEGVLQDRNINIAVPREGEVTFYELIKILIRNRGKLPETGELEKIPGIAFVPPREIDLQNGSREVTVMDQLTGTLGQYSSSILEPDSRAIDPAYIIFTSGSTGRPKGVMVEHRGVVNTVTWFGKAYNLDTYKHVIQMTNFSFDPSVEQTFGALLNGAVLYPARAGLLGDREIFRRFIEKHDIHILNFVPTALKELLGEEKKLKSLQAVISGGEVLDQELKDNLMSKGYRVYNQYGPTETTIDALMEICSPGQSVTLGRPISNTRCYILGKDGYPVPIGIPGVLYIAGAGVSRGYLNSPDLTHDNFLKDPLSGDPGQYMFKTGDMVRWLPDGRIEFLGRKDLQIKIRGFRVELEEIENRLTAHARIKKAVVTEINPKENHRFLCAFYVPDIPKKPELLPSVGDYCIWDDMLYYAMAHDKLKNNAYKIAIDGFVKGKTVVEVGTGKDMLLGRMAVEAGAEKVYAVEILEEFYKKARLKLIQLGLQDKIHLIHGDSRDVELPEKVDIHVSNQIGSIGSSEGAVAIHNDALRFLKEKHLIIPARCVTKIAAVTLTEELRQNPSFSETSHSYAEKIFNKFGYPFDVRLCIQHLPKSNIISDAGIFEDINFSGVIDEESCHSINLTIDRKGLLDGFILWINFYTVPYHLVDTLEHEHIWKPVYMPAFSPPLEVDVGDRIQADCLRSLSPNKRSQDYMVKGVLITLDGKRTPFLYNMPYFEKTYQGIPLYEKLFNSSSHRQEKEEPDSIDIYDLRKYLSRALPDYMIPEYFIPLKELPITSNGKIDRKALEDPAMIGNVTNSEYVAPVNTIEKKLSEIWESVLGKKNISRDDDFFSIGGDSIKAIQIAARINQEGYKLKMKEIFSYPRVADLATKVKISTKITDQTVVTGPIDLLPVQKDFFSNNPIDPHHFNQAVMLYSEEFLQPETITRIFQKIQEHHDALRMTFKNQAGSITQNNAGLDYPFSFEEVNFNGLANAANLLQEKVNKLQGSIDLENGPMMKLGLFHLDDGDRLLIIIHHLVMDGVSWRILFEDIESLYRQYKNGEPLRLPPKSDSLKTWSEKLHQYANSPVFLKEKGYWKAFEFVTLPPLKTNFALEVPLLKDCETLRFLLEEKETTWLLTDVNRAFNTEINDILLTALGLGLSKIFNSLHRKVLIALEGHGREDIFSNTDMDIDVSRTVGWFTSVYHVLLDFSHRDDLGRLIKEIKETLHRVPHKGIGYGILKYLTNPQHKKDIHFHLKPQISFNYLGQFDEDVAQMTFKPAVESPGNSISLNARQEYNLEVSGMIAANRLTFSISYNKNQFRRETIKRLLDTCHNELNRVITFCLEREKQEVTPVDLDYKDLSEEALDSLFD